jgi:hypothetical protein
MKQLIGNQLFHDRAAAAVSAVCIEASAGDVSAVCIEASAAPADRTESSAVDRAPRPGADAERSRLPDACRESVREGGHPGFAGRAS